MSWLFFIAIVFIKLPPFYLFPFITSTVLTNHTLAKGIFLFLTIVFIKKNWQKENKHLLALELIFIFFLTQSISVFGAKNLTFFWKQYQNIIFSVLIFVSSIYIVKENQFAKRLNKFFYYLGICILGIEALFFFFTDLTSQFLQLALQKDMWSLYAFNLQQGRHNLFLSSEIFLPFFVLALFSGWKNKNYRKLIFNLFLIVLLIVVSIMTNFRTKLMQLIIGLISSLYLLSKIILTKKTKAILVIGGLLMILVISRLYFNFDNQRTSDQQGDTAFYRYQGLIKSIDLFKKSPLVGVGLGNYKYHLYSSINVDNDLDRTNYENSLNSPHSIISEAISETGIVGLLGWLLMIFYFVKQDIKILRKRSMRLFPYMISAWIVFAAGLVNPFYTIFHTGWFWFLRGIIEGEINE